MAADWIKMRTDLYRDPKVCMMADALLSGDGELARYVNQHCQRDMTVTRNVMRNVTVGALVSVWGVMRVRGKAEGSDLVCRSVGLGVIDDIADLPGFGAAMALVGWAVETPEGLVFPRFFDDHNVDPESAAKQKAAERQKRYRERQKAKSDVTRDVTNNVTVTHREEKRREEKNTSAGVDQPLPGFDRFWEAWPRTERKTAKAECRKRWKARGLEALADQIVRHVEAMAQTRQWREGFEPAPLTYLNQRRWEDAAPDGIATAMDEWGIPL